MPSVSSDTGDNPSLPAPEPAIRDHWDSLIRARSASELCAAWLPIVCNLAPSAVGGLLLLKGNEDSFVPAAMWPEGADLTHLRAIAEETLNTRRGGIGANRPGYTELAYPLVGGGDLLGAVILDLKEATPEVTAQVMRQLHWGAGWLVDLHNRHETQKLEARLDRSAFLFDLVLSALAEDDKSKSALTTVNRLAQRFKCHQVQYGVENAKTVKVEAVSQSAWFDERANLINLAALAMNEAYDQRVVINYPRQESAGAVIVQAHQRYAEESQSSAICSIPLISGVKVVGIWLLERNEAFTPGELEMLEALALAVAPVIELKQAGSESLLAHGQRTIQSGLRRITDTSYPGWKLVLAVSALLVVLLAVIEVDYRIGAPAVIEGATQRSAVAPFDGYIQSALARAGDLVHAGQILATLEDKDLQLERARWTAELEVAQRKAQESMAKGDRVEFRLASAQADQALAQLNLALERLSRIKVSAPFDGVVVRGDLSQQIGSPVEQGKVLFEISPLAEWRVILKIDERDIAHLRTGNVGDLVLTSLPSASYPLEVTKITPVATAEDGRNFFRVEANLTGATPALRPNMEGVAKVVAGKRNVLWIWTHRLTDWIRITLWKLMP